ncbi:MAG: phosphoribosylamine--glycine ligase [Ignavibacterium sp.]|nr:MAG: phosphoribosylamine--glycine ligase [Ignavibacterium sp.]
MRVVVIGSGGREHALAQKISESADLEKLFIIPGNPGTASCGENVPLNINNNNEVVNFCKSNEVDLVIIGPEQPLVNGLGNALRERNILVFGPDQSAARIESDKSFAKMIMKFAGVPTAHYIEFNELMYEHAVEFIKNKKYPCVIKANGLAAGKGVVICDTPAEAQVTLRSFFIDKDFGKAGESVLIEEFLEGEEASVFAITDGENFICLPPSQDYKKIGDDDKGKNTGGMGAYAPAPIVTNEIMNEVAEKIIKPTLRTLQDEGKKFIGCLYAGLMLTTEGPKVIEFNCRFGDPETQSVLPLVKGNFLGLLHSAAKGKLDDNLVSYNGGSSVCVVVASKGYPETYQVGFDITGLDKILGNVTVFHAGTKNIAGKLVTNGGRVLGITSVLNNVNFSEAKKEAYDAISKIHFNNMYYRKDISNRAIKIK